MYTETELNAKQAAERLRFRITRLRDRFYSIYWDGNVPHDEYQLNALVSAIYAELEHIAKEVDILVPPIQ